MIEEVKIPSTKGNLSAVINNPENKSDKLAILCPGYLDSKDYLGLKYLAKTLCNEGYVVARFDPTGTWKSDGDISDYTMTQYLEDIKNVFNYMLSKTLYTHILLGGHSRGGQMSLLYAARDSRISLVLGIMCSYGPITGQRRDEWEKTRVSIEQRDFPDNKNKEKEYRVPFSHVLDRDKYDLLKEVKKIQCPIILVAGERDDLVPPEDVKDIYDNANEPKRFSIIKGIGHDYRFNTKKVSRVNQEIIQQLRKIPTRKSSRK